MSDTTDTDTTAHRTKVLPAASCELTDMQLGAWAEGVGGSLIAADPSQADLGAAGGILASILGAAVDRGDRALIEQIREQWIAWHGGSV